MQQDWLKQFNITEMPEEYYKHCIECGEYYKTNNIRMPYCGTCVVTAQALFNYYTLIYFRWGITIANPNPIVEKVFNVKS